MLSTWGQHQAVRVSAPQTCSCRGLRAGSTARGGAEPAPCRGLGQLCCWLFVQLVLMPVNHAHLPPNVQPGPRAQAVAALASGTPVLCSCGLADSPLCCVSGRRGRPQHSPGSLEVVSCSRQVCAVGGGEHEVQHPTSLSLPSSQDLKVNSISKEINFKVPFYARVKSVLHATAPVSLSPRHSASCF